MHHAANSSTALTFDPLQASPAVSTRLKALFLHAAFHMTDWSCLITANVNQTSGASGVSLSTTCSHLSAHIHVQPMLFSRLNEQRHAATSCQRKGRRDMARKTK